MLLRWVCWKSNVTKLHRTQLNFTKLKFLGITYLCCQLIRYTLYSTIPFCRKQLFERKPMACLYYKENSHSHLGYVFVIYKIYWQKWIQKIFSILSHKRAKIVLQKAPLTFYRTFMHLSTFARGNVHWNNVFSHKHHL